MSSLHNRQVLCRFTVLAGQTRPGHADCSLVKVRLRTSAWVRTEQKIGAASMDLGALSLRPPILRVIPNRGPRACVLHGAAAER
jgi:hypothetical protein